MGFRVQGINVRGTDTYLSVPGLKIWIGGDSPADLNSEGRIIGLNDIALGKRYYTTSNRHPVMGENAGFKFVKTQMNPLQERVLCPWNPDYRFMHDGSPFGFFAVMEMVAGDTPAVELFHVFGVSSSANNIGYCCRFRDDSDQWSFRIFNGAGETVLQHFINARNVKNQPELLQHVYKGRDVPGNDSEVYFNKTLISTAETNPSAEFAATDGHTVQAWRSNDQYGGEGRGYLVLFYDWSGYSPEQIDLFRERVQNVIYGIYGSILPTG